MCVTYLLLCLQRQKNINYSFVVSSASISITGITMLLAGDAIASSGTFGEDDTRFLGILILLEDDRS